MALTYVTKYISPLTNSVQPFVAYLHSILSSMTSGEIQLWLLTLYVCLTTFSIILLTMRQTSYQKLFTAQLENEVSGLELWVTTLICNYTGWLLKATEQPKSTKKSSNTLKK